MSTKRTRGKTSFTLKLDMSLEELNKKYGFTNIKKQESIINQNITQINDLSHVNQQDQFFSFLDESKKLHTCYICMVDRTQNTILKKRTNISCFWCKNPFTTIPIGCPISYISPQYMKQHYSEITKDKYVIKESITQQKVKELKKLDKKDKGIKYNDEFYYETDGVFCSFNCCLAFINDNYKKPLYKDSKFLLAKLYSDLFDSEFNIKPAFDWRLLDKFGGNMTIEEFRNDLYSISYENTGHVIKSIPTIYSIGSLYKQTKKF